MDIVRTRSGSRETQNNPSRGRVEMFWTEPILGISVATNMHRKKEGLNAHQEPREELHRRAGGGFGVAHLAWRSRDSIALDVIDPAAVSEIDDECCTHVLADRVHGTCVRVIEAAVEWAPEKIEASLVS